MTDSTTSIESSTSLVKSSYDHKINPKLNQGGDIISENTTFN